MGIAAPARDCYASRAVRGTLRTRFNMRLRGQDAMDECEARTQEAFVAALRTRPRTTYRAVQCELGSRNLMLKRVIGAINGRRTVYSFEAKPEA